MHLALPRPSPLVPSLLIGAVLLTACSDKDIDTVEPHVVKGIVRDTNGNPLPGVDVFAHDSMRNFSYVFGKSDEKGHYRIELDPDLVTSYWVRADLKLDWDGQSWEIALVPNTRDPFPVAAGAIRNFDWKLKATSPADNEFINVGGAVYAFSAYSTWGGDEVDTSQVELHFEPSGPRIDGSHGEPFTSMADSDALYSVPLGRYTITARHVGEEATPLHLRVRYSEEPYAPSVETGFVNDNGVASMKLEITKAP